jgi:hypothetical protein
VRSPARVQSWSASSCLNASESESPHPPPPVGRTPRVVVCRSGSFSQIPHIARARWRNWRQRRRYERAFPRSTPEKSAGVPSQRRLGVRAPVGEAGEVEDRRSRSRGRVPLRKSQGGLDNWPRIRRRLAPPRYMRRVQQAVPARPGSQPGGADSRQTAKRPVCDFCGSPRARDEHHRLVWESTFATELVLAELCSRCAAQADRLLEMHGGRGRDAISLARPARGSALPTTPRQRAFGFLARGLLYLLVALAFFFIVTLITSRAR